MIYVWRPPQTIALVSKRCTSLTWTDSASNMPAEASLRVQVSRCRDGTELRWRDHGLPSSLYDPPAALERQAGKHLESSDVCRGINVADDSMKLFGDVSSAVHVHVKVEVHQLL